MAVVSGLGGGNIRDILLGALPQATFSDWRYLAVAAVFADGGRCWVRTDVG